MDAKGWKKIIACTAGVAALGWGGMAILGKNSEEVRAERPPVKPVRVAKAPVPAKPAIRPASEPKTVSVRPSRPDASAKPAFEKRPHHRSNEKIAKAKVIRGC